MKKFKEDLVSSALEFKKLRVLCALAVMGALAVALEGVASIRITPNIKIGFSGYPNQVVDLLFGPVTGGLFGGLMDVLKFFIIPSGYPFHPGYTLDAALAAFIYGCFYYRRPVRLWRILAAKGIVALVVNIGLATYWQTATFGQGFWALLPARALKNVVMWPIESAIFYVIAKALESSGAFRPFRRD